MAEVAVEKHREPKSIWSLFDETSKLFDELQGRAYTLFEERGRADGQALDDWLRAERERFLIPPSDISEDGASVHVKAAVPGLRAKDLDVTVTPHELVIRGRTKETRKERKGETRLEELSEKSIFRRYGLPAAIDVDHLSAKLEDGMLSINMRKAEPAKPIAIEEKKAGKAA